MTILRRAVPVLAAMTVAMTLSSCLLRALGWTKAIDAVGFLFAAGVYLALLATRRWHGVGERVVALPSLVVVGISFPVLRRAAIYLTAVLEKLLGADGRPDVRGDDDHLRDRGGPGRDRNVLGDRPA